MNQASRSKNSQAAYNALVERSRQVALISSCSAVLGWDEQTYMPHGGAWHRGEQMATLAGLAHERATDPQFGDWLTIVEEASLFPDDSPEAANMREWRWRFDRAVKTPQKLVEQLARVETKAQQTWIEARKEKTFARLMPDLQELVALKQQQADCLRAAGSRYDSLLEEYEPGASEAQLSPLLDQLGQDISALVDRILEAPRPHEPPSIDGTYPLDRQQWFSELVASTIGFDFNRGRLDLTAHPFCSGIGPGDCRLTTRFRERDFTDGFFSVLHEMGHGLYEQGLEPARFGTPSGEATSLGVHESQSRFWENTIGRGAGFWEYWLPIAKRTFRASLSTTNLDDFLRAINKVERSLIRVEADEVTYNLHIVIRYQLERALISGELPVADLPAAWNAAYLKYLKIEPDDDAQGCLQDIHWSAGLFGYFPTYTIGNLLAAQLAQAMTREQGPLDEQSRTGDFKSPLAWLRDKVHQHGQRYRLQELTRQATGQALDPQPMLAQLTSKYGALYGVN